MGNIYTIEHAGHLLDIEADSPDAALSAANSWTPPAAPPMTASQQTDDIAKSAGIGLAKGAIDVLGAPGDLSDLLARGSKAVGDYVGGKLGYEKSRDLSPSIAPGSGAIQKAIEGTTGEFYKPKSTAGGYVQAAAEAVPAALLGPGGTAAKVATGIGSGVGGEFLGNQYQGTAFEPYAKIIGGAIGGAGIAGAGKGVEAARNIAAAKSTGQSIGDILGTEAVKPGAVRRVAQSAADDSLTSQSAADTQAKLGPEAMLMDLGRQMQGRAEAVALPLGKAQNTVLDAVEGRTGEYGSGARSRIEDTLEQHLGPTQNVVKVLDDVDALVQKHAGPAYQKVMTDYPVINVPSEITSRPAVAQAMKNAETLAANYGEKLGTQETHTILSGPGYHIADDINIPAQPSLKYWDYVKKGMDQRINNMMKSGIDDLSSKDKADLGGLLNAKQSLVSYLDGVTGGAYADARRIAATKPELHEAMDFGRSIFNTKLLPEEVQAHIQGLSIPEQGMVQVGARRELARVLDSSRNDGAKARSFLDTNNNLAKVHSLFGPDAAQAIQNRVAAENTFQQATENIARNSRTATRQQLVKDTEDPAPASYAPSLLGAARAVPLGLLNYVRQNGMQNTRSGIADILTAKGDQISPVVEQLLKYNQKKAANAATPIGQQAGALIRALIAGSGS